MPTDPAGRHDLPDETMPESPTDIPKPGWTSVLRRAVKQFKHDDVSDRAAALTYFGVLAIFPAALVLVSILGLLGRSTVQSILNNTQQMAPGGVSSFLHTVVKQVQGNGSAASAGAIVGIVIALWSASGYIAAFMRASNAIYEIDEGRPIWRTIPVRVGATVAVVIMLVACAVIVVVTGPVAAQVGSALGIGNTAVTIWNILKWPVLLIVVSLMFSLLYWACPNVRQPSFRWITPGGVLAVVIWLVASGLFGGYVSFSGSYNKTYGTLATVIVFLVWLWISNIAILLGLEFNAESERQRMIQAGVPADVEPYVELRDTRKLDEDQRIRADEAARLRRRATS